MPTPASQVLNDSAQPQLGATVADVLDGLAADGGAALIGSGTGQTVEARLVEDEALIAALPTGDQVLHLTAADAGPVTVQKTFAGGIDMAGQRINNAGDGGVGTDVCTLQQAQGLVTSLWLDQGSYDASVNTFPALGHAGGPVAAAYIWTISIAGTLGGTVVNPGDTVRSLVATPGQTAGNWAIVPGAAPKRLACLDGSTVNGDRNTNWAMGFKDAGGNVQMGVRRADGLPYMAGAGSGPQIGITLQLNQQLAAVRYHSWRPLINGRNYGHVQFIGQSENTGPRQPSLGFGAQRTDCVSWGAAPYPQSFSDPHYNPQGNTNLNPLLSPTNAFNTEIPGVTCTWAVAAAANDGFTNSGLQFIASVPANPNTCTRRRQKTGPAVIGYTQNLYNKNVELWAGIRARMVSNSAHACQVAFVNWGGPSDYSSQTTPGGLTCGNFPGGTLAALQAISSGGFAVTVDGGAVHQVTGLDFTSITSVGGSAPSAVSVINAALVSGSVGATCALSPTTLNLMFTSANTTAASNVSLLSAPAGGTDVSATLRGTTGTGALSIQGIAPASFVYHDMLVELDKLWYDITTDSMSALDVTPQTFRPAFFEILCGPCWSFNTFTPATNPVNMFLSVNNAQLDRVLMRRMLGDPVWAVGMEGHMPKSATGGPHPQANTSMWAGNLFGKQMADVFAGLDQQPPYITFTQVVADKIYLGIQSPLPLQELIAYFICDGHLNPNLGICVIDFYDGVQTLPGYYNPNILGAEFVSSNILCLSCDRNPDPPTYRVIAGIYQPSLGYYGATNVFDTDQRATAQVYPSLGASAVASGGSIGQPLASVSSLTFTYTAAGSAATFTASGSAKIYSSNGTVYTINYTSVTPTTGGGVLNGVSGTGLAGNIIAQSNLSQGFYDVSNPTFPEFNVPALVGTHPTLATPLAPYCTGGYTGGDWDMTTWLASIINTGWRADQ